MASRRNLLKSFFALPLFASITKLGFAGNAASADGFAPVPASDKGAEFAVKVLRLINTAQNWHMHESGRYAELRTLINSNAMQQLLDSIKAEKRGIGRRFFDTLHFDMGEIAPGWQLNFKLGNNGSWYLLALTDVSGNDLGAWATDELGVIYEGTALASVQKQRLPERAKSALENGRPIGSGKQASLRSERSHPSGIASTLMLMAFGAVPQGKEMCCSSCCECSSCAGKNGTIGCLNCGCEFCVWCCGGA